MESFVERFRAQATKARQAQSRLKALERMQRIAPAHVDSPFEFEFRQPDKLPRPLLALENQSAGYGERVLLQQVSLTLAPGERLALLGRNGAGKSTLMKLLAGELAAGRGRAPRRATWPWAISRSISSNSWRRMIPPLGNLKRLGGGAGNARHRAGAARFPGRVRLQRASGSLNRWRRSPAARRRA